MDMETVKVDLQKLQLLNDRITQTIEALDQVRASVHGIQHSVASQQGYGYGQNQGWAQSPFQGGLSHSSAQLGGFRPYSTMMQVPQQAFGSYGYTTQQMATPFVQSGISHTGFGPQNVLSPFNQMGAFGQQQLDPSWQMRVAQTFPFAGYPIPPVTIY